MMTDDSDNLVSPVSHAQRGFLSKWLLLVTLCVLNLTNATLWISYSSVTDFTELFYGITADQVNYFALIFPIACLVFGLPSIYIMDRFGTRVGLLCCGFFGALGGTLRYVSCIFTQPSFPVALAGQFFAALAQPFCLFASTAVASEFSPSQRATANTLGSMSNPLGILLANIVSPAIATSESQLPLLTLIYFIAAMVAGGISIFNCFCGKIVPAFAPPSLISTDNDQQNIPELSFMQSLKICLSCRPFWLLIMSCGLGVGLFSAFSALIEQILCPFGYTDQFSGACGAVLIAAGLVGAAIAGLIADNSKTFTTLAKICFAFAAIGCCLFAMTTARYNSQVYVILALSVFGGFGFAFYPISLELGVECTFPVGEAISSGTLVLTGQLATVLFVVVGQVLAQPMPQLDISQCAAPPPLNYQLPVFCFAGLACIPSILFILAFKCPYKRKAAEAERMAPVANVVINNTSTN